MTFDSNRSHPAFKEGMQAFDDEISFDACPYTDGTDDWFQWGNGWEHAEFENSRISDDDGYNDPRRGQADAINAGRF